MSKFSWKAPFNFGEVQTPDHILLEILIWKMSSQNIWQNQFSTIGSYKMATASTRNYSFARFIKCRQKNNQKYSENADSAPTRHFQFKHFPKSNITSESRFLKKYYIITILKFFFGAFRSIFPKVKKWIAHCIFKSCSAKGRGLF